MTSTGVRTAEHPESNGDCMTAVASLLVGAGFFSLWFWLLPGWLGFHVETTGAARWRWIAAVPSVLGFAVALRCVWDFGRTGHGTPAPIAPPKRLVVLGVHLFVLGYEEPTLRRMFAAEYEEYCRNVPRWLPRVRPWERARKNLDGMGV